MSWSKWVILTIGALLGAYMAFDGSRALIQGDYLTPRQGEYAGQLGPWAGVLRRTGLEPRSTPVKIGFIVYGICWLALASAYAMNPAWSWWPLVILSVLTLWYLPMGTGLALLELVLLVVVRLRVF
ncbi:MAG TPA: hypothetical protein VIJ26_12330 [Thermoanaerobaculia bacterium]|jgi:hypothetical protein